jgi:hypothetical protein
VVFDQYWHAGADALPLQLPVKPQVLAAVGGSHSDCGSALTGIGSH